MRIGLIIIAIANEDVLEGGNFPKDRVGGVKVELGYEQRCHAELMHPTRIYLG